MSRVVSNVLAQLRAPQDQHGATLRLPVGAGDDQIANTIAAMRAIVHHATGDPIVLRAGQAIAASVRNRDGIGALVAVDEFLRKTINFKPDTFGDEVLRTPMQLLTEIRDAPNGKTAADCDDVAMLGASLVNVLGRKAAFVTCSRAPGMSPCHVHYAVVVGNTVPHLIPFDPQERVKPGDWTAPEDCREVHLI
jgi:hypothetical protein